MDQLCARQAPYMLYYLSGPEMDLHVGKLLGVVPMWAWSQIFYKQQTQEEMVIISLQSGAHQLVKSIFQGMSVSFDFDFDTTKMV